MQKKFAKLLVGITKRKTLNSSLLLLCYMMQEKGAFSRVAPAANFYGCADG